MAASSAATGTRRRPTTIARAIVALVGVGALTGGCAQLINGTSTYAGSGPAPSTTSIAPTTGVPAETSTAQSSTTPPSGALEALTELPVKGRAPKTGYDRAQFGPAWLDIDDNGCDTRNDVLARALVDPVLDGSCVVVQGTLLDPYAGELLDFADTMVDVDHVVSLGDAWQKGAQQLDLDARAAFANDPLNLVATQATLNRQKGAGDAATWLPPARGYRCTYVVLQIAVKARYALWVTAAERAAMTRVLDGCPGIPLPAAASDPRPSVAVDVPIPTLRPSPVPTAAPIPVPPRTSAPPPVPTSDPPAPVYYENCDAVRAAGAAPIHRGEPGYAKHLDRDGDGVGCES